MKRLFLDTNILVDLICHREPFFQEAKRLFALAYMNKVCIGISALSYINTVYIAKKYGFCIQTVIEHLKKNSIIHHYYTFRRNHNQRSNGLWME